MTVKLRDLTSEWKNFVGLGYVDAEFEVNDFAKVEAFAAEASYRIRVRILMAHLVPK